MWSKALPFVLLAACAVPVAPSPLPEPEPPAGSPTLPLGAALLLGNAGSVCSAVAVTPELVFTAKHCVDGEGSVVVVAPDYSGGVATEVVMHPEVDFAAVLLGEPVTEWAPLATDVPAASEPLWVAGYGCLHGSLEVRELTALWREDEYTLAFAGRVCPGDSGSPVFNAAGEVAAIAVAMCVTEGGEPREPPCGAATLIAAASDLVEDEAVDADEDAGLEP